MEHSFPAYRVAATQIAPCFLDLDASVEKACQWIEEAAAHGARLIGFPEAYLPGYPWWAFMGPPVPYGLKYWDRLYRNAFEIPGPQMAKLAACARKNKIYVCMSGTELDHGSLYLTQVWFNDKGDLIGKHRKLRPTAVERTIWGEGDGSMMPVFETELGNLGGLLCWEHRMPANLLIMNAKNEQVHVSGWPTGTANAAAPFATAKNVNAAQYYAVTTGTFVIMCTLVNDQAMADILLGDGDADPHAAVDLGYGHAGIIDPSGNLLTEWLPHDQEGLLYADIDLNALPASKYFLDCAGHYYKGSVGSLTYHQENQSGIQFTGTAGEHFCAYEKLEKALG